MPSRAKKLDRAVAKLPSIPRELVDQFLSGPMSQRSDQRCGARLQAGADRGFAECRTESPPGLSAGGREA